MRARRGEQRVPSGRLAEPLQLDRELLRVDRSDGRPPVGQRRRRGQRRGHVLQPVTAQVRSQLGPGSARRRTPDAAPSSDRDEIPGRRARPSAPSRRDAASARAGTRFALPRPGTPRRRARCGRRRRTRRRPAVEDHLDRLDRSCRRPSTRRGAARSARQHRGRSKANRSLSRSLQGLALSRHRSSLPSGRLSSASILRCAAGPVLSQMTPPSSSLRPVMPSI